MTGGKIKNSDGTYTTSAPQAGGSQGHPSNKSLIVAGPRSGPAIKRLNSSALRSRTVTTRTCSAAFGWASSTRARPSWPSTAG
jgi:hypothetical protein